MDFQSAKTLGSHQTKLQLTVHIVPLMRGSKAMEQFVESTFLIRCKLKPSQKIERLLAGEVAAVMKSARHRWKVLHADRDVPRVFFDDGPALVLRQGPPLRRLANGDEYGMGCAGTTEWRLPCNKPDPLLFGHISLVADYTTKLPGGLRCDNGVIHPDIQVIGLCKRLATHWHHPLNSPVALRAPIEDVMPIQGIPLV